MTGKIHRCPSKTIKKRKKEDKVSSTNRKMSGKPPGVSFCNESMLAPRAIRRTICSQLNLSINQFNFGMNETMKQERRSTGACIKARL